MKDNRSIEEKINDALNSIDHVNRATPVPFFYTRLMARMNREDTSWGKVTSFVARPVVAFATILLVIFINVFAVYNTNTDISSNSTDKTELAAVDEYSQISADNNTIYDIENTKP